MPYGQLPVLEYTEEGGEKVMVAGNRAMLYFLGAKFDLGVECEGGDDQLEADGQMVMGVMYTHVESTRLLHAFDLTGKLMLRLLESSFVFLAWYIKDALNFPHS